MFKKNVPDNAILLCLAEGVDKCPEWTQYIKSKNFKVECHGWDHIDYKRNKYELILDRLKRAKAKLEDTFNQEVTIFHPPRNFYRDETIKAANEAGMRLRTEYCPESLFLKIGLPYGEFDSHYWIDGCAKNAVKACQITGLGKVTFILGAPRSGTTALLGYLAQIDPRVKAIKEKENIWKLKDKEIKDLFESYEYVIEKNARNAVRLDRIINLFPDATYIHIIRDGRAVANSRRNLDMRMGRYDETIEHAAYQWVQFVNLILKRKKEMKNYREVRYEDLCKGHERFDNRNYKWYSLTDEQKESMEEIELNLLKQLYYL